MDAGTTIGLGIALGTLLVTLWLGRSRLKHERVLADLGDARGILAETAAEFKRLTDAIDACKDALGDTVVQGVDAPSNAEDLVRRAWQHWHATETLRAGIRVRFSDQERVVTIADKACVTARQLIFSFESFAGPKGTNPEFRRDDDWETLAGRYEDFIGFRDEYLKAAQTAVGSSLPGSARKPRA
jgi:hypothetical protein